jgi:hypothetical protein
VSTAGAYQASTGHEGAPISGPLIRVRIERLVLEGLEVGDGAAVARALEAELAARLGAGTLPAALTAPAAQARLQAPAIRLDPAMAPASLGRRVAEALDAGLRPATAPLGGGQR